MFTIGIDYGCNSVRALVVRASDGAEFGSCVIGYPSGDQGILRDPRDHQLARQHPGDYLFGLEESVKGALAQAVRREGFTVAAVAGIGVESTGSSSLPSAGSGRTTRAGARPGRSRRRPRSSGRTTSSGSAAPTPPSGGPRSGTA